MKQASLSQGPESAQAAPFFKLDAVVDFVLVGGVSGAILLVVYGALRNLASR
jgi:hypothetical protein